MESASAGAGQPIIVPVARNGTLTSVPVYIHKMDAHYIVPLLRSWKERNVNVSAQPTVKMCTTNASALTHGIHPLIIKSCTYSYGKNEL